MPQQNCPNCGTSFDGEADAECPHCGDSAAVSREIWRRYFLVSFFGVPALAIGLPFWIPQFGAYIPLVGQFPRPLLVCVELLSLTLGAGASAYLLARSEGKPSNSGDVAGYWMLIVALYAMIAGVIHVGA